MNPFIIANFCCFVEEYIHIKLLFLSILEHKEVMKTSSLIPFARNAVYEFSPVLVFFLSYQFVDILSAIFFYILASILVLCLSAITEKKLAKFPLFSGVLLVSFGLVSLFFEDPRLFVWYYTLFYSVLALLLVSGVFVNKSFFKWLFDSLFAISQKGWTQLSIRWALFYAVLAISNEWVWIYHGEEAWVQFRFMMSFAIVVFGVLQFPILWRNRLPEANSWGIRIH